MKKGEVEKAERIALNQFDKWNEVTGFDSRPIHWFFWGLFVAGSRKFPGDFSPITD